MQHFTCADMMIERHFLCPFHICVNVRSDITWFQPRKCMSSNLYKGMTHEFQTSIRMNEIWNHAIPIVSALEGLQGFQGIRSSPSMSWETSKLRPAFLETGQCPDQEDPLRESHCWSSSGVGWREGFEATLAPSTLVDLTWIHTEI